MSPTVWSLEWQLSEAVFLGDLARVKELVNVDGLPSDGHALLLNAVKLGHIEIVKYLLEKGANMRGKNTNAYMPTHFAVENGSLELLRILLESNVAVEAHEEHALLVKTAKLGHMDMVKYLLEERAVLINAERSAVEMLNLPIRLACERGHLDVVKLLFNYRGEDINNCAQLEDGYSALHAACKNGRIDVVSYLLTKHADPNIVTKNGSTPLHLAAAAGYLKMVDALCKNGAKVDLRSHDSSTPLLLAVKNGHVEVVKLLLYRGSFVDLKDSEGNAPLYFAIKNNNPSICECILQFEPEIDQKIYKRMLKIFRYEGYSSVVDDLIVYSSPTKESDFSLINAVQKGYKKTAEMLLARGVDPNNKSFVPPLLHSAFQIRDTEMVKILLKAGCAVDSVDLQGKTPLHYLFRGFKKLGSADIFQSLIDSGADWRKVHNLLHKAVENDCIEVCKYLIENGADVNGLNGLGYAPLHFAAASVKQNDGDAMRGEIARLLLTYGAYVNFSYCGGETTLHFGAKFGLLNVARVLFEFNADPNAKDRHGRTPLHYALINGHVDFAKLLLVNRAQADAPRKLDAATPLHIAACKGYVKIVELLLEFQADINARDSQGHTPLLWAFYPVQHAVIAVLFEHGCDVNILDRSGMVALSTISRFRIENKVRSTVVCHILRLKAAKFYVRKEILNLMRTFCSQHAEKDKIEEACNKEVEKMKKLKLCCHLTLYNALKNPCHPAFIKNESVLFSFVSVDWNEFVIYGSLIRNKLMKNERVNAGKYWLNVLIATRSVLHQENSPNLPLEVMLEILSYLNKSDLNCLIACGEGLKCQLCRVSPQG